MPSVSKTTSPRYRRYSLTACCMQHKFLNSGLTYSISMQILQHPAMPRILQSFVNSQILVTSICAFTCPGLSVQVSGCPFRLYCSSHGSLADLSPSLVAPTPSPMQTRLPFSSSHCISLPSRGCRTWRHRMKCQWKRIKAEPC